MFTKAAIILSIIFCKNKNNNCDFILQFRFFLEILSLYLIIQMFGFFLTIVSYKLRISTYKLIIASHKFAVLRRKVSQKKRTVI